MDRKKYKEYKQIKITLENEDYIFLNKTDIKNLYIGNVMTNYMQGEDKNIYEYLVCDTLILQINSDICNKHYFDMVGENSDDTIEERLFCQDILDITIYFSDNTKITYAVIWDKQSKHTNNYQKVDKKSDKLIVKVCK